MVDNSTTEHSFDKLFNLDFNSKGEVVNKGLNRKQRRKLGICKRKFKSELSNTHC